MTSPGPLGVAVISRYPLVRAGLTHLIHSDIDRAVVVKTAPHDGHLGHLDVVLYDLAASATRTAHDDLAPLLEHCPVLGLVREGHPITAERLRTLGVRHTVPEDIDAEDLLDALERATGRRPLPRRGALRLPPLSERERQILGMIGAGLSNTEIADQLFLSQNSIKTYIRSAYKKIAVTNRRQAILWVMRHDLAAQSQHGPG